jgi:hypothetical protein
VGSTDTLASGGMDAPAPAQPSQATSPPRRRVVRIRGRLYPVLLPSIRDPRLHVAAVLLTLQILGQTVLDFRLSIAQILICLATGALIEFFVAFFKDKVVMWPASGMLTGNSTAFILRTPGTLHGDWWSLHGIWIFIGVVAVAMASKYLIRWRGRHIFNPSNLALVLAFVALGPRYTEPLDLWWISMGQWMIVAYAVLIIGGLLIGWELRLLGLELGFLIGFAAFVALAVLPTPDHCLIASWHATAICGRDLWTILATSPEILIFGLFMVPDPRTVPEGRAARVVFGVLVALLSVLLLGPTTLEFWTKTAILGSLVIACAGRFALVALVAPLEKGGGPVAAARGMGRRLAPALAVALVGVACLPVAAQLSTHDPVPAAELSDGTTPTITLVVGTGPDPGTRVSKLAAAALPSLSSNPVPAPGSARVWVLPSIPAVSIPSNVSAFNQTITPQVAAQMAHDVVLDLIIESDARRAQDMSLAQAGAEADALTEFTDVISGDVAAGHFIQKTYVFNQVSLTLFLPKYSTQASRLVGVTLTGTATLTTREASGNVLSQTSSPYSKSWGLGSPSADGTHAVIGADYTDLALA